MKSEKQKQVVLITGCSSGFGLLTSIRLAQRGYEVVATMRNLAKRGVLDEAIERHKLSLTVLQLDVTDIKSIEACLKDISEKYGHLDVLVNNAGYGIGGFFEDLSDKEYRDQLETNFFGVLNMIRLSLPLLRKSSSAKIINISSVAGLTATPGMGAYNTSKWALEGFSESLRQELSLFGIQVLLIEPCPYPTEVLNTNTRFAEKAMDPESPNYEYTQKLYKKYLERNETLKSDPNEVAKLIESLIVAKNPPFRNVIGPNAKLRYYFRRFFPWRLNEWLVKKVIFG